MPLPPTPSPAHRRARAAPSPVPRPSRRHIAPLDGLRGVAVLGVLFFHAGHFDGGFLGVDLFLVLSGFLITGLLLKEARARDGRIDLLAFWGRRARRLLPALAVVLAGTLLLVWALGPPNLLRYALDDGPWVAANLANWHFVADRVGYWDSAGTRVFSHLWSIAVEEQFYVVWPLVLCLTARGRGGGRRVAAVAAAGAAASLVLMVVLTTPADTTRVYEGTDTRAFSLLLGALAATEPAARLVSRLGERATGRWSLALAAGIGAYWITADGQNSPSLFRGGLFLHALAAALLIACLARAPRTPAGRFLAAAPLRRLGTVSYSLYLWHWPVYLLLSEERLGREGAPRTAVLLAVSVALAVLSKVLVEDPVRFRARWAKGRTGAVALVAAFAALAALWTAVPQPRTGEGSVDVTRLGPGGG
ncbi:MULTISPECIES: acyltransferase family protein [Streptomyces]|uniref:Possible integral membrane protein n=1 Tax=Streptomyces coelicolor (strain ATCC BAA-471 / A3(2) / M145) TaxID=100226 RepID=Q9KYZ8_STRCO|nr:MULTISPECIES: acyltransferase [Streptomyces]MDX2924403.1 acyltransferase [Streptomyces sp. NRRL_B-16638]MDX3399195.1 acyltransferase [Streptomyces sp. ME01-18h]MDX3421977.1 acyltransferase [Streptomyces sp. ME02-6985-2c]MYU47033.1 acyltransferase family protein [Streptomyces sp. SID7813]NSL80249.1 acyltransferase [Streptomyces coelicolor]